VRGKVSVCPPVVGMLRLRETAPEPLDLQLPSVRLLYVGRIAPHKKVEDLLALFHEYQRREPDSCLFLVGAPGEPAYVDQLAALLMGTYAHLGSRVYRLGRVSNGFLRSLYENASAFLTMSEHEGFCVPLVEAMIFEVPVFAFAEPAVTETLGNAGRLFEVKDFPTMAAEIHRVLHDDMEREAMLAAQQRRLAYLQREADGHHIWKALEEALYSDARNL
jgi:glycosyltransferase involved in cell wall biosynthesis